VKEDGGDLELVEVTDDGVARVELKGACRSCSMNNMTFKAGVEEAILTAVPEVQRVEAVGFQLHK
jgi:Fe-S cluster biogenesis protein NfuA